MIGRLRVLLPFVVSVRSNAAMAPQVFDIAGYGVRLYPPYRTSVDPSSLRPDSTVPMHSLTLELAPLDPQPTARLLTIDGQPTIQADGLQIDFLKNEFTRARGSNDPPTDLIFVVINGFLSRLRLVTRAIQLPTSMSPHTSLYRLTYLNDDETELPEQPGLARARVAAAFSIQLIGMDAAVWESIAELPPTYALRQWDELMLASFRALPDVGASLVLAYTMLETRVEDALNTLATGGAIAAGLWKWINDRGDWRKEPSVGEQFDVLMKELGGSSLKDVAELWEAFRNLNSARNSFAHNGVPKVGDTIVDAARATELLKKAVAICDWIETKLPPENRRPAFNIAMQMGWGRPFIEGPAVVHLPSAGKHDE
jgi:hypothetical protein